MMQHQDAIPRPPSEQVTLWRIAPRHLGGPQNVLAAGENQTQMLNRVGVWNAEWAEERL